VRYRALLASSAAAALVASLASAAPAFASTTFRAGAAPRGVSASPASGGVTQHSPLFAGYIFPEPNNTLNERATFAVPTMKCGKRDQGVGPSVGMNEQTSGAPTSVALLLVCHKGKPLYFAALTLNGTETNYKVKAHAGDKIALFASENFSKGKVTLSDLTTKVKKSLTNSGTGGDAVTDPWVGDTPVFKGTSSRPLGVPNFGQIDFTGAKIFGQAVGKYPHNLLERFDRYNASDTTLQIHTSGFSNGGLSFKTLFKHS
jgi:hypothetical protein